MNKPSEEVVLDWVKNKKRIQDRLNRINKKIKKYQKQKAHFEFRRECVKRYETRTSR